MSKVNNRNDTFFAVGLFPKLKSRRTSGLTNVFIVLYKLNVLEF